MVVELLKFPHKQLRAECIKEYMQAAGYSKAVCFTCGNAARALTEIGVDVLHIGGKGALQPCKWWQQEEIEKWFFGCFDATSGHLPISLMQTIGNNFKHYLCDLPKTVYVPTGSGETLVCLKLAFPEKSFVAVYNLNSATEYNANAPLNKLVELLADNVIFADKATNITYKDIKGR